MVNFGTDKTLKSLKSTLPNTALLFPGPFCYRHSHSRPLFPLPSFTSSLSPPQRNSPKNSTLKLRHIHRVPSASYPSCDATAGEPAFLLSPPNWRNTPPSTVFILLSSVLPLLRYHRRVLRGSDRSTP
ncbi:hypothetical protein RND81_01G146600 [Saponaria officinalis]|uniref:Uncharacterized protein n=1 Tax=Saponaria officinalis TaxID=3572 RepID=A0AAW1N7K5_SAPOF